MRCNYMSVQMSAAYILAKFQEQKVLNIPSSVVAKHSKRTHMHVWDGFTVLNFVRMRSYLFF